MFMHILDMSKQGEEVKVVELSHDYNILKPVASLVSVKLWKHYLFYFTRYNEYESEPSYPNISGDVIRMSDSFLVLNQLNLLNMESITIEKCQIKEGVVRHQVRFVEYLDDNYILFS
jgi:hypothetical protein